MSTAVTVPGVGDGTSERPRLPFPRPDVLELSPFYDVLRREAPVTPVTTPAGDPAWLVTRYEEARSLLGDSRLGRSHPHPERAARVTRAAVMDGPSGDHATEEADHARMRRLLTPAFSARRMRRMGDDVQALVDGCVDDLVAAHDRAGDGVADLHATLALPLPVTVICGLLGVPREDSAYFRDLSDRMATDDPDVDAHGARAEFGRYMVGLAERKRAAPAEDVISDLVAAQAGDASYDYDEMIKLAVGLLFAGHETTVNRIGLGTLLLLTRRERWEQLVADPTAHTDAVVEEILRLGAPGDLGLLRYAHTDVELGGVTVPEGDAVIVSVNAANRDPAAFADAEAFEPGRAGAHVGFGHGKHFCIGASLARTELRATFATLARRLPDLRLAADLDDIEVRTGHLTGGVTTLPVTW